jgi:hypothetical protein
MRTTPVSCRWSLAAVAAILPVGIILFCSVARCADPERKEFRVTPEVTRVQKRVQAEQEKGNLTDGQAKVFGAELERLMRVLSAGNKDASHAVGLKSIGPSVGRDLEALEGRINLAVTAAQKKAKSK